MRLFMIKISTNEIIINIIKAYKYNILILENIVSGDNSFKIDIYNFLNKVINNKDIDMAMKFNPIEINL